MEEGNADFPADKGRAPEAPSDEGFAEAGSFNWQGPLLGELAVQDGLIGKERINDLLALQRIWGTRLGEIMVSTGAVRPGHVARLISRQSGARFVDLQDDPADPTLAHTQGLDFYIDAQCMPWKWTDGETAYVAADPGRARAAIAEHEGRPCPVFVASAQDIDRALRERFHVELSDRARFELSRNLPESSARQRLTRRQIQVLSAAAALLLLLLWQAPAQVFLFVNITLGMCFLAVTALRGLSVFVGLLGRPTPEELAFDRHACKGDAELPVYSVLVPLFREAAVLPILADALKKLDYPASKLDIKLIFEESDEETWKAAKALRLPGNFEFIRVPHSLPLTKPKACNYALPFARGEFLVVYDAEDLPASDQLRRAVAAFDLGDENLACVQAQLNYYNWSENWLTRQFALEYASFFDLLLPTLSKLGMPIPLGGTSTHFRTAQLRKAGAWDPFNVTEDADLGMRFALLGFRTGIIRSTTHEEANCALDNWMRQRSRWIKGWMQTYLVRMRHPIQLYRALGLKGFLGFQIIIGGFSLSALVHPIFYLIAIIAFAMAQERTDADTLFEFGMSAIVALFNILVLVTGYSITIIAGMTAAAGRGLRPLIFSAFMMPAYWLLISLGAYKAICEFVRRPFHWQKTDHGISRMTGAQIARVRATQKTEREHPLPLRR